MLSGTPRWHRVTSDAGGGRAVRERDRGPLGVMLAATLLLLIVVTSWPALDSVFSPQTDVKSDALPIWLLLEGHSAHQAFRARLEVCSEEANCDLVRLGDDSAALAEALASIVEAIAVTSAASDLKASIAAHVGAFRVFASRVVTATREGLRQTDLSQALHESELLSGLLAELTQFTAYPTGAAGLPLQLNLRLVLIVISSAALLVSIGFLLHQRVSLKRELTAVREAEIAWRQATLEVFDSLPVPVLVVGQDRSVRYANQAAKEIGGSPAGEDVAELARRIRRSVESQAPSASGTFDFPLFGNDGSVRHVTVAVSPFRLLGDITQTYVIADNTLLRDAELRALTAGKLAVLGELSSAVAHELNQPLAVIKAAAANGRNQADRLPGATRIAEKFTRIDEQIERARRIIENVRRLGRPVQSADAIFSVAQTLRSTFGLVSQQYKIANISLETDLELDEFVKVSGEGTLFEIAVLNILLNARDALAGNARQSVPPLVRVRAYRTMGIVHVIISDNAGGIPKDLLPRIFESFVSSKSADAGTGLGLSIARRAIEGMQGKISAANAGDGAVFSIELPAFHQEANS